MRAKLQTIDEIGIETGSASNRNISWQKGKILADERTRVFRAEPTTIWLTGLSGSGKSTIAFELERRLFSGGYVTYVLDGDNIRHGLSADLGFSPRDRKENIRRIAEVAKLFNDAGMLVITAFISPYREDRAMARAIIGSDRFIETYVCADVQVCEQRDPKGLYKRVRRGDISEFTGITAPYEAPSIADLEIDTACLSVHECVEQIMCKMKARLY